nr:unnamed protein product [Digitaria exilis]
MAKHDRDNECAVVTSENRGFSLEEFVDQSHALDHSSVAHREDDHGLALARAQAEKNLSEL